MILEQVSRPCLCPHPAGDPGGAGAHPGARGGAGRGGGHRTLQAPLHTMAAAEARGTNSFIFTLIDFPLPRATPRGGGHEAQGASACAWPRGEPRGGRGAPESSGAGRGHGQPVATQRPTHRHTFFLQPNISWRGVAGPGAGRGRGHGRAVGRGGGGLASCNGPLLGLTPWAAAVMARQPQVGAGGGWPAVGDY